MQTLCCQYPAPLGVGEQSAPATLEAECEPRALRQVRADVTATPGTRGQWPRPGGQESRWGKPFVPGLSQCR